jgi:hypothetical protein
MKTATINLYQFNELSDEAKERAREWWRTGSDYPWWKDSMDSITAFCNHFGVSVKHYEIGLCTYSYLKTDAENAHFRGVRLADCTRDAMPTGYCLDCTLWETFYDSFKASGSAKVAFEAAIDAAVASIEKDLEYHESDECIDELLTINEYDFTEDGRIY